MNQTTFADQISLGVKRKGKIPSKSSFLGPVSTIPPNFPDFWIFFHRRGGGAIKVKNIRCLETNSITVNKDKMSTGGNIYGTYSREPSRTHVVLSRFQVSGWDREEPRELPPFPGYTPSPAPKTPFSASSAPSPESPAA